MNGKIRNPKLEIRNKFERREIWENVRDGEFSPFRHSNQEFVSDFGFRISNLTSALAEDLFASLHLHV